MTSREIGQKTPEIASAEVITYLNGATTPEYLQFEFLIGCWDVEARRVSPEGDMLPYLATWEAKYVNDKRMVIDDFRSLGANGEAVSSYVTLRTYSPVAGRWEFAGIGAQTAAAPMLEWYGTGIDREMHLHAKGFGPDGKPVDNSIRFYDITENQFRWESHMSADGGQSWINIAELVAQRSNKSCQ